MCILLVDAEEDEVACELTLTAGDDGIDACFILLSADCLLLPLILLIFYERKKREKGERTYLIITNRY